jgi:hypothetical protein
MLATIKAAAAANSIVCLTVKQTVPVVFILTPDLLTGGAGL